MHKDHFLEKLLVKDPDKFERYDYTSIPDEFTATDKIFIRCKTHGFFYQKASSHMHSADCPKCGLLRPDKTHEFIAKSISIFGNKFGYEDTKYIRHDIHLQLKCPIHGNIYIAPEKHFQYSSGCKTCETCDELNAAKELEISNAVAVHGELYCYDKVLYKNRTSPVTIICPKHGPFKLDFYTHVDRGCGCKKCGVERGRVEFSEFVARAKNIHGNKYEYLEASYSGVSNKMEIRCNIHGAFKQRAGSHLSGNGCLKCHQESTRLSLAEFIQNARKVHGENYDYSKVIYTGNKHPVEIICYRHGSFWQKPNTHVSSKNGCGLCCESKGERQIANILNKYSVEFFREYRIKPHLFRYDFFIPKYNVFIEFHGHQHYWPVKIFGGDDEFEKTKNRDRKKQQLVNVFGGKLIVLTYLDFKDDSLEEKLVLKLNKLGMKMIASVTSDSNVA